MWINCLLMEAACDVCLLLARSVCYVNALVSLHRLIRSLCLCLCLIKIKLKEDAEGIQKRASDKQRGEVVREGTRTRRQRKIRVNCQCALMSKRKETQAEKPEV